MSSENSSALNDLFVDGSTVAIVTKQRLRPADGPGAPFFPPTYLGSNDRPTYCINPLGDGKNLCTIDSVQSQANRIEGAFLHDPYRELVRKVTVTAKLPNNGSKTLDMLQLPHRLADAAIRFSTISDKAKAALRSFTNGPDEIAKLSPMSLLCGLWESRGEDSQFNIPRAFSAIISARDVHELHRMATVTGSFWSKKLGLNGTRTKIGMDPVPVPAALGGVVADGEIIRTAMLNLIALRWNTKVIPGQSTSAAARYVLGLGLVALTMQPETFLRQGCLLVEDGDATVKVVPRNGREIAFTLTHEDAMAFAVAAAVEFGVASLEPISADFQTEKVKNLQNKKDEPAPSK
jgi:CRISPR-associated protein Csb1